MSTAESSCTNRSSSIFCCSSAMGCSKSRKVCFIAVPFYPLRPRQRLGRLLRASAARGERLVGDDRGQHERAADERGLARMLAEQRPYPDRSEDGLEER